jgi:hypothetical protein
MSDFKNIDGQFKVRSWGEKLLLTAQGIRLQTHGPSSVNRKVWTNESIDLYFSITRKTLIAGFYVYHVFEGGVFPKSASVSRILSDRSTAAAPRS